MSDRARIAALAGLPGATSARLGRLLQDLSASEAWSAIIAEDLPEETAPSGVRRQWAAHAPIVDLDAFDRRLETLDVHPTCWHDPEHPPQLTHDLDPAPVLFRRGTMPRIALPHVAIIGTRRSSSIGREIARDLGAGLAAAGVVVVSGLALGIDGEAHRGALLAGGARPVAVVGSGIDIVYPKKHHGLWHDIAARGALVTEAPLGGQAEAWRFPARNRLIAALADLVVVVESRGAGGSLLTVEQAMRRDVEVMAVPGSVRNAAAEGTNQLIVDGCAPVRDVVDVLVALGLSTATASARRAGSTPDVPVGCADILEAIDDGPTSVDQVVQRTQLGVVDVYARVEELVAAGLVVHDGARVRRR